MRDIWLRKRVPYRVPVGTPSELRHNYVEAWSYIQDGLVMVCGLDGVLKLACVLLKEHGTNLRVHGMQLHNATCADCAKVFHDFYTNYGDAA